VPYNLLMQRRDLLKFSALSASFGLLSGKISSNVKGGSFKHGVASGDPTHKYVILWTRVTPKSPGSILVTLEVSSNNKFNDIVYKKRLYTDPIRDYTIKHDFNAGLYFDQGQSFYFRFKCGDSFSDIGRSQTFPKLDVRFACLSCSNYPTGFFNAYEACANENLDFWLHLGDYLYEYSDKGYGTENASKLNRVPEPSHEIVTLGDYRTRHSQYKLDEGSKKLHAFAPLIPIWDDHEFANDAWMRGAENHAFDGSEGTFLKRRAAAIKAYMEWMPIREHKNKRKIYRQFKNPIINLMMLDTRQFGRDEQIKPLNYLENGRFDRTAFFEKLHDKERQLLGKKQLAWIDKNLRQNSSTWVVAGQQILMTKVKFPKIKDLLDGRNPPQWLEKFLPLQNEDIPSNLDAWDGYPAARSSLYDLFKRSNISLISLAGDTHNSWVSNLKDDVGDPIGFELGTPSVTSPGVADSLNIDPKKLENGIKENSAEIAWMDAKYRGYLICKASNKRFTAQFKFIDTITKKKFNVIDGPMFEASTGNRNISRL